MVDLVEKKQEGDSEYAFFRKTMCCYINFSIDSVISNGKCYRSKSLLHVNSNILNLFNLAFERCRTSNRVTNYILYSYLSVRHMFFRCRRSYRIGDIIKCFSEPTNFAEDNVVLETKDFTGNPVNLVGTNIPSFYGGLSLNGWDNFKNSNLLPKDLVASQDQDLRQGPASSDDFKLELLGSDNCIAVLFKRIKRICQIQSGCKVAFREGLPEDFPVYISIDGENYILRTPEQLTLDTNRCAR